jgi:serine phosphatase RsbU (regulator of sigma subunit)
MTAPPIPPSAADRTLVMAGTAGLPAAARLVHFLVVVEGWQAGLRIRLEGPPLSLGRSAGCSLVIPDSQVSSRHCEVGLAPMSDQVVVRDLGSTNGTFVENRRVEGTALLGPGELLRVGGQVFRHDRLSAAEAARAQEQDDDLDKARRYVESLLPPPIAEGPVRTEWCFVPSAKLGGDAFGYHQLAPDCFSGYLMDVSGHGVGAAMHSVSVMNVLRQRALPGVDFRQPAQVLRSLNEMFQMESHGGMYFSIWYGVYDTAQRTLTYASAGHHPSYLSGPERGEPQALRTRNLVIGAMPGAPFQQAQATVAPGSTLYVFSDGVFEIAGPGGEQRDLPDFLPHLRAPRAPAGQEAQRLYGLVRQAARPGPLDDDFTLLAVTFP